MRLLPLLLSLTLAACASQPELNAGDAFGLPLAGAATTGTPRCGEEHTPHEVVLHLDLIEDMTNRGLYHAALAHLDALGERGATIPRAHYLRAELQRHLGNAEEAARLYQGLTTECLAGLGYHGLGRLAVARGDLTTGLAELARAEQERPTDARIRNDYGYALLLAGDHAAARARFQTALELGGGERAAANLVLVLLMEGDDGGAKRLADRFGFDAKTQTQLRERAADLSRKGVKHDA